MRRAGVLVLCLVALIVSGIAPAVAATTTFQVTFARSVTPVAPLAPETFSGTVTPAAPGAKITVQEQSGTTWRTVGIATLSAKSTYSLPTSLDLPARTGVFRAAMSAVGKTKAGYSPTASVTVRYGGPTVRQISAGGATACALTTAGGVFCWGSNRDGQLGDGSEKITTSSTVPLAVYGLSSGVADVSVGADSACALTTDGRVLCWGTNTYGQLGTGARRTSADVPVPVPGLPAGIKAISVGGSRACALTPTNGLLCWGVSPGDGSPPSPTENLAYPVVDHPVAPVGLDTGVAAVAVGGRGTCAVLLDGSLRCWGEDSYFVGDNSNVPNYVPVTPHTPAGHTYRTLFAGQQGICGVTTTGGADCWGLSNYGQLGDATATYGELPEPKSVAGWGSGVSDIGLGDVHSCAVVRGRVSCLGLGDSGRLGSSRTGNALTPVGIPLLVGPVAAIAASTATTCAVSVAGAVLCWGDGQYGELGTGSIATAYTPASIKALTYPPVLKPSRTDFVAVSSGADHSCGLTTGGAALCWGVNKEGQLGDGGVEASDTPVPVHGLSSGVVSVVAGSSFSCALSSDALVRCWGLDANGQLGNGRFQGSLTPVVVGGLTDVATIAVSATGGDTCAVTKAGALYCWGSNTKGQLGTGHYTGADRGSATPMPVQGLDAGVRSVAVGTNSACALTVAGAVWCWGNNDHGQLGTGDLTVGQNSPSPAVVPGLSGITTIAAGDGFACALPGDGSALCWGAIVAGVDTTKDGDQHSPRPISGLSDIASLTAGSATACAVTRAGAAYCWGGAPLGDGLSGDGTVPQPVRGLGSGVRGVSAGDKQRCAVLSTGGVTCWSDATHTIPRPE
jgi:alpha-tubulin suppressor-like RCC1 family protein